MGVVYTSNDEDGSPQVFVVDVATGKTMGSFDLNPALPGIADPEALSLDWRTGVLYLADIGDNNENRPTYPAAGFTALYALTEPGPGNHGTLACKRYPVGFPGNEKINAETLAIHPTTGFRYICTKEPTRSRLYRYGALSTSANNIGTLVSSAMPPNVTDACFTLNGKWLLIRVENYPKVVVFDASNWKQVGSIDVPSVAKGESITVEPGGKSFLIGSEGANSPLYRVLLPTAYRDTATPTPGSPTVTPTQPAPTLPGQILDLRFWKLTMPIGSQGSPMEILQPKLNTYEHAYFRDSNGRVVFTTPYGGVTTSGSVNPRTELREMWRNGSYGPSAWNSGRGRNLLTLLNCSFTMAGPNEREVVIAQMHDGNDDRVMIKYKGTSATAGDVWCDFGNGKGNGFTPVKIISGYTLGTWIRKLEIVTLSSGFYAYVNGVQKAHRAAVASGCYFKAGCYPQSSSDEPDSALAQTRIQGLILSHT